jgi:2'-5' RNA ligase
LAEINVNKVCKVKNITGMMAHQCYYCLDVFKTIPRFYQHARLAHKEIIQKYWIPCPNCQNQFPNKSSLTIHKKIGCEKNHGCFVCEYCTTIVNSLNEQRNHVLQCHPEEMSISGKKWKEYWKKCSVCDSTFETRRGFGLHLTICQRKERRTCKECKKIFSTKELMLAHARVMHVKQFEEEEEEEMSKCWTTCKVCDQKIQTGRNFVQHMTICNKNKLLKNPEIETFNHMVEEEEEGCQVSKPFFSSKDVRTGQSSANDQAGPDIYNAKPPNCTANYEYKTQLTNGIIAYNCQFCTNFYKDISNCYRHTRLAHNEAVQQYWIPCPNCKKYFRTKKTLETHTNINCLGCEHCNKVLNSRNELRNHVEQNHPEEMSKYWTKCLICDIKFRVGRSLSCHLKLCRQINHPEEMSKVWKRCKACDKKIQTGQNFVQHMTICNGKKLLNNTMACNKKFLVGRSFTKHWNKCQQNQVRCQICKEIFSTKEVMLAHARVMHVTHVELFWCSSCPDCKLTFPSMAEVKEHVCVIKLSQTKKDLNLDNIDVTLEWLMSKTITTITMLDV